MRQPDWNVVRALPLFCGMSEHNFKTLTAAAALQHFPQHAELITEGNTPDFLKTGMAFATKASYARS